ncbi:MAG: hypothetical protein ACO3C1_05395 [Ilumatobacteraceae bacterium]
MTTRSPGSVPTPSGRVAGATALGHLDHGSGVAPPPLRRAADAETVVTADGARTTHATATARRRVAAPLADPVTSIERHGLRVTLFADATVTVAAPHIVDVPCEHLVDAALVDTRRDGAAPPEHLPDVATRAPRTADHGRFVVHYEPLDDSGPIARIVSQFVDRARPTHDDRMVALHLVTERSVHIIDLSVWRISTDEAAVLVDLARRTVAERAPHRIDDPTSASDDAARIGAAVDRDEVARRLRELAQLHDEDLITDQQYADKRAAIIASL